MIYSTAMNITCFEIIVYLLGENGVTYQDFSFWGIIVTILVMHAVTTLYCKEVLSEKKDD